MIALARSSNGTPLARLVPDSPAAWDFEVQTAEASDKDRAATSLEPFVRLAFASTFKRTLKRIKKENTRMLLELQNLGTRVLEYSSTVLSIRVSYVIFHVALGQEL